MAVAVPEVVGTEVADATAPAPTRPRFVLVGGVPGAGKTTVINGLATEHPEVVTVDPDRLRPGLLASSRGQQGDGPWSGVHLVDRDTAGPTLAALLHPGAKLPGSW